MRRRSLLRAVALACTPAAGCLGRQTSEAAARTPRASIRMSPVSDSEIAQRVHGVVRRDDSDRGRVLDRAIANGTASVRARRPPLEDGDRVVYDGTLYRVSTTVTDQQAATVYPIVLDDLAYENVTTAPGAARVRFADLPAVDREVFRENGLADGSVLGIGTNLVYTEPEVERSVLVPTPEYSVIVWDAERRGRFGLRGEPHDTTVATYRYAVETVAESAAAHGGRLREQYAVDLTDVPAAEAEILTAAAEGNDAFEVPPGSTPSAAFQSLADRFRPVRDVLTLREGHDHAPGTDPRSGTYLVRYDGQVYWTQVFIDGRSTDAASGRTSDS